MTIRSTVPIVLPALTLAGCILTPTQFRILDMIADGQTNPQVAAELGLPTDAVKVHMWRIGMRLGIGSRAGMVGTAYRRGIFEVIPAEPVELTVRQTQVVRHGARGLANSQIAVELGLRPETVKSHWKSAVKALDAHTRAHAVRRAVASGALPLVRGKAGVS